MADFGRTRLWAAVDALWAAVDVFGELLREPEVQGQWEVGDRSGGHDRRRRDQLGELPEVLGGGGEEELVAGAVRPSKPEAIEAQDALEVSEQHLDLLALAPGGAA